MFEQKYEKSQKNSTENCHFYSREKSLYVAWACFHNDNHVSSRRGMGTHLFLFFYIFAGNKQMYPVYLYG